MTDKLFVYNSLSGEKEEFVPIHDDYVGMYVCGPTVYSDVHLGNCRTFVSFDIIYRYLKHLGYKVRYVRNITDVGHLEGDADIGREDKISKKAKLERIEPMEVVQRYASGFHEMMRTFNVLSPSIEPRATGHIIEQIQMIEKILKNGYGYVKNGSVYFDTIKFAEEKGAYGVLSGRVIEDLLNTTRELKKQDEKRSPVDFALWIKADPEHLMKWPSPWSLGFPGWHLECSAMSTKYLGETFDIHGGGNDLKFPHHENEIAQNIGACNHTPANYWLHTNMLLLNGKKMSKSDGNSISPAELFTGESPHISKSYSPMVVRFFMLQAHYRSTLDLTEDALLAAEKGYSRMMQAFTLLDELEATASTQTALDDELNQLMDMVFADLDDDFNTPKALSRLFEMINKINAIHGGQIVRDSWSVSSLDRLKKVLHVCIHSIFGLADEKSTLANGKENVIDGLMNLVIELRANARNVKDWNTADTIRDGLNELSIELKDGKEGTKWSFKH